MRAYNAHTASAYDTRRRVFKVRSMTAVLSGPDTFAKGDLQLLETCDQLESPLHYTVANLFVICLCFIYTPHLLMGG